MKWIVVIMLVLASTVGYAQDITLKDIPDGVTEQQVKEWVAILIERIETAKINQNPVIVQATKEAQTTIDGFRKANALAPKWEVQEESIIKNPVEVEG